MASKAVQYAVTGASGFTGRHIAARLAARGETVLNLSGHPERPTPSPDQIISLPFSFHDPARLAASLSGVRVLINSYWVRNEQCGSTFAEAETNSRVLIECACQAGVQRIVHVSIANPDPESPLPYYSGKARVEQVIAASGMSYAILRPTVIFGDDGILINNIAWFLRHLPVFGIPGSGTYALQPAFVEDMAEIAVEAASGTDNSTIDVVGPEVFEFAQLLDVMKRILGSHALCVPLPSPLALAAVQVIGALLRDVILTRDEVRGLQAGLLASKDPPTCKTKLSEWMEQNRDWLGRRYFSELARRGR